MSSLLQHHGGRSVDGRKVELLMYLEEWYEAKPLRCTSCGQAWQTGDVNCRGCGRFVLFVWKYGPNSDPHAREEVLGMDEARKHPNYAQALTTGTCTVSNYWRTRDVEPVELTKPDGTKTTCPKLYRIYRIYRRPVGVFGCWVTFRYNGEVHAPDLSVPISVLKLPRDAEPLTDEEAAAYWFSP